jgi:hypothetical protein
MEESTMSYQLIVRRAQDTQPGNLLTLPWEEFPVSTPFVDAVTGNPASFDTTVQATWDEEYLYIRFMCEDRDIVATMVNRDDPLYEEEVVEVFIAPENLSQYYEFNLSPRNVVFDSLISHDGKQHHGDPSWDCSGLIHRVIRKENNGGGEFGSWEGLLAIPFSCLGVKPERDMVLRANFFRIKRAPHDEYMAWSPTMRNPANFHVPQAFGELKLV